MDPTVRLCDCGNEVFSKSALCHICEAGFEQMFGEFDDQNDPYESNDQDYGDQDLEIESEEIPAE